MPTFRAKFATSKPEKAGPHITAGVGEGARSTPHDTALVQTMLKGVTQKYYSGRIDGKVGPKTLAAIRAFQTSHVKVQSNDRPGLLDPRGMGVRTLAQMYAKHIVVIEGTTSPYLVPVGRDAKVRGWIAQLDWAEPMFRKDLEAFALALTGETAIGLSFRPLPSVPHPSCETAAEAVFADFTWINQEGWEVRAQGHALTGFAGAQQLERALHAFARQFELFFKVAGKTWPLTVEQSPVRYQERVRQNPRLDSVWVENPIKKQELILMDPKTGRLRTQGSDHRPIIVPRGLGPSQTQFDPPCSLPKFEPFRGATQFVIVEFQGKFQAPLKIRQQGVAISTPRQLTITDQQVQSLGLGAVEFSNLALNAAFTVAALREEYLSRVIRMFVWPTIERLSEAAIGLENFLFGDAQKLETGLKPRIEKLISGVADKSMDPQSLFLGSRPLGLMTLRDEGRARLSEILKVVGNHDVPAERVFVGDPMDGIIAITIERKGAFPTRTGDPILDGALIGIGYRKPTPGTRLNQWARSLQQTHRPPPEDYNDFFLETVNVAGAFAVDILVPPYINLALLFFGAVAESESVTEGVAHILFKEGKGKAIQLAVKRAFPPGTIANAMKRVGIDPETARIYENRVRVDLEGVIVELLEGVFDAVADVFGESEKR